MAELIGYTVIVFFIIMIIIGVFSFIALCNGIGNNCVEQIFFGFCLSAILASILLGSFLAEPKLYGYEKINVNNIEEDK